MALSELGNLATILLNQLVGHDRSASGTPPVVSAPTINASVLPQDRFTPSTQPYSVQTTAQQAGLFQISRFSAPTVAVEITHTQPVAPRAPQNPQPAQLPQPVAAPARPQVTPEIAAPTNAVTTATTIQDQLQTLNLALAALGLSNSDIQSLDRIASLVKDFNPVAYRTLVFQLQELAQRAAPRAVADAANSTSATTGGSANSAALQIAGLQINFSGSQGAAETGSANGKSGNQQEPNRDSSPFSALSLQVVDIRLTLTNNNAQTIQLDVPQLNARTASGLQPASQTKAAAA